MKSKLIIRAILIIAAVAITVYGTGTFVLHCPLAGYSWVLVLFLFFKLFSTVLKIFGIIIRSIISLCLSALKICFLIYLITLIV